MLLRDLRYALRSLLRRPIQSALRVAVLALGLFCFLAAHLCVSYFRSYDGRWAKADRTYAIFESLSRAQDGLRVPMAPRSTPLLAEQLALDASELETVARYRRFSEAFASVDGEAKLARRIAVADPQLLDIFDFDVVAGDLGAALSAPNTAVITESAAEEWFGATSVVGRTVTVTGYGSMDVAIAAVIRDPPSASHLGSGLYANGFDLLVPWDLWRALAPPIGREADW